MFDAEVDRPPKRQGLSQKGWAKYLLFWLAVSIGLSFLFGHLSNKDAQAAGREKVVTGTIVQIHKGKNDPTDYSFQFEGINYRGQDSGSYLDLTVGGSANIYLDPQSPEINGLRSFGFKRNLHHDCMTFAVWFSIGLAFASVVLWVKVFNDRTPGGDEEEV